MVNKCNEEKKRLNVCVKLQNQFMDTINPKWNNANILFEETNTKYELNLDN